VFPKVLLLSLWSPRSRQPAAADPDYDLEIYLVVVNALRLTTIQQVGLSKVIAKVPF
jgi:hypothetical protein